MKKFFLLCYDISSDKKRKKAADICEKHGERWQFSVFRLNITENKKQKIMEELSNLLERGDSLFIIPLEKDILSKGEYYGIIKKKLASKGPVIV